MIDYKEKYEELLIINAGLNEELNRFRSDGGSKAAKPDYVDLKRADIRSIVPEDIFSTISSYLMLCKVSEDKRIFLADLNARAAEVESVSLIETRGKCLDDLPLRNKQRINRLVMDLHMDGSARKLPVSESGDDSHGYYLGFSFSEGNILLTWEPGRHQKTIEEIRRQKAIFEEFAEMLPEMVYEVDINGRISYANAQALNFFGYSRLDLLKGTYVSQIFPDNFEEIIKNLKGLLSPEQVSGNEYIVRKKDGSQVPILTHTFAIFHEGKIIGYRGVVTDMSRHKEYEDRINREKAFLELLIDSIPEAIAIINPQGKITSINREFTDLFCYSPEEAIGKNIDDLIVSDDMKSESVNVSLPGLEKTKITKLTTRKDKFNRKLHVSLIAANILIDDEIVASLGIYRDISQERKSQLIQEILYNISTAALHQMDIKDIYPTIVHELGKIWDTNNFFIALYDKKTDTLSMPFFSDEKDNFERLPARKTITRWVIGLKKSVLLKENDLKDLENSGDIALVGAPCKVWMGIPLKADKEIIGVMALQDYHDEDKFSHEDVNVLEFIANQTAIAIQRRTMLENVITASRKAEEAAQSKQQFMSTMSHEIRTPLNEVIGITNLLLQGNPREDQMDFIRTLRFSGNHLLTLVNDVLDYNKMESGKIVFEQTQFNLSDFLNDIMRTYSYRSKSKNLGFEIIKGESLPVEVVGDSIRLNQILSNLLSNALKFTQKGSIHMIIKELQRCSDRSVIEFRVKDTGIGIPADKHEVIFESFSQASPDTTRHYGGTGLGLSICKKLVELQGGKISIESEPGIGSTFIFSLSFGIPDKVSSVKPAEISEPCAGLEGKRILVAEDNKINFFVANKFLTGWGVIVTHAENGKIALEILHKEDFDLVIMDLHMPVMDGIEATRIIRQSPDARINSIPVVALTAAIMSESHDKIDDLNINDYVLKPFRPQDLFDKIMKNIR